MHNYNRKRSKEWQQRCVELRSMGGFGQLPFTRQPYPVLGNLDLASVFFSRHKLAGEHFFFGNFTDPERYPCLGCQDGYFTQFLVSHRLWSFHRLPLDGLQSIVFHGPSPAWCVASGNVWLDHPDVDQVGCLAMESVEELRLTEKKSKNKVYDWKDFDSGANPGRICLRLSEFGYFNASAKS